MLEILRCIGPGAADLFSSTSDAVVNAVKVALSEWHDWIINHSIYYALGLQSFFADVSHIT